MQQCKALLEGLTILSVTFLYTQRRVMRAVYSMLLQQDGWTQDRCTLAVVMLLALAASAYLDRLAAPELACKPYRHLICVLNYIHRSGTAIPSCVESASEPTTLDADLCV